MSVSVRVGIDLGTSTSEVAYYDTVSNRVTFVPFGEGRFVVPSAVLFDQAQGRVVVGWPAHAVRVTRFGEVALNVKRQMGNPRYRFRPAGAPASIRPPRSRPRS